MEQNHSHCWNIPLYFGSCALRTQHTVLPHWKGPVKVHHFFNARWKELWTHLLPVFPFLVSYFTQLQSCLNSSYSKLDDVVKEHHDVTYRGISKEVPRRNMHKRMGLLPWLPKWRAQYSTVGNTLSTVIVFWTDLSFSHLPSSPTSSAYHLNEIRSKTDSPLHFLYINLLCVDCFFV